MIFRDYAVRDGRAIRSVCWMRRLVLSALLAFSWSKHQKPETRQTSSHSVVACSGVCDAYDGIIAISSN